MFLKKINTYLQNHPYLAGLWLFLIAVILFSYIQYSPTLADPDSFYHLKMAELIARQGIVYDFPYLHFTVLRTNYIDHHFLFHVILAPFVFFLPAFIGGKICQALLASLTVLCFYWLLKRLKAAAPFWLAALLLLNAPWVYRLSLIKAQPLSLIIIFLACWMIIEKRYYLLLLLGFIYVWTYDGWFLLLVLGLISVVVDSLDSAWTGLTLSASSQTKSISRKLGNFIQTAIINFFTLPNLKLIGSITAGLALGIIINPYFPQNLYFYWVHIVQIGLLGLKSKIAVGAEWYSMSIRNFFIAIALPLILILPGLAAGLDNWRRLESKAKFLLATALVFLAATIRAQRNIEYFIPLAVLAAAVLYASLLAAADSRRKIFSVVKKIKDYLLPNKLCRRYFYIFAALIFFILLFNAGYNVKKSLAIIRTDYLRSASNYLLAVSQPNDLVFNSDWDIFPELFYYNNKDIYIVGLDPAFMYLANRKLYQEWADITRGEKYEQAYQLIKYDFQAKYALVAKKNKNLLSSLENNFHFKKIYDDSDAAVYQVN